MLRWHDEPAYREFLASAVADALGELPRKTKVVFTAHSLPERVLEGDPYPEECAATARAGDTVLTAGGRVLGVTALGDTVDAAREKAYAAVAQIRFEGMQFRRDIAAPRPRNDHRQ